MSEVDQLRAALDSLADEAARAVCEPRRFHDNEDQRQQALGQAVARARLAAHHPGHEEGAT